MKIGKRITAGALLALLGSADIIAPMTAFAADVVTYSKVVSDLPSIDISSQAYTGSTKNMGTSETAAGPGTTASSATSSGGSYSGTNQNNSLSNGPKVVDVTPTERYYDDYEIYSESINGLYYFFATVGNNGITDKPVSVDFPANMTYTMEKDGVEMTYLSKQQVSDYGTYVFKITINEDTSKPVSEQVIYRSTFIFRIQPKAVKPVDTTKETASAAASGTAETAGTIDNISVEGTLSDLMRDTYRPEQVAGNLSDYVDVSRLTDLADQAASAAVGEVGETKEETKPVSETENETRPQQETTASQKTGASGSAVKAERASAIVSKSAYVPARGTYRTEFTDGSYMEVTSPNGLIGNTKVYVSLEGIGGSGNVTLLKNGKKEEMPEGGAFDQPGNYCMLCSVAGQIYPYSFRILDVADSRLDFYTIPEGLELTSIQMDGRPLDPEMYRDKNGVTRLDFTDEAVYTFTMSDPNGPDFDVQLTIDRTAPDVTVTKDRGTVKFSYNHQEVKEILLKNGKTETSYTQLGTVDTPGNYEAEFYDYAGNMTRVRFEVTRQINLATIAAILMIIALIALIIVFYRRTKTEMNVK